jgi:hypothetical protein
VRNPGEAHTRIAKEILGEKAAALGRAGERLEAALRMGLRRHAVVDAQYPEPPVLRDDPGT